MLVKKNARNVPSLRSTFFPVNWWFHKSCVIPKKSNPQTFSKCQVWFNSIQQTFIKYLLFSSTRIMLRSTFGIMNKTKPGLYDLTVWWGSQTTAKKCFHNLIIFGFARGNNDWMECCKMTWNKKGGAFWKRQ